MAVYDYSPGKIVLSTRSVAAAKKAKRLTVRKKPFKFLGSEWYIQSVIVEGGPDGFKITVNATEVYDVDVKNPGG